MKNTIEFEHELNRKWIYDDTEVIIGETNFVVPTHWLKEVFNKLNNEKKFVCEYNSFKEFEES